MGTRISFALTELLGNPSISVCLTSDTHEQQDGLTQQLVESTACVTFTSAGKRGDECLDRHFDYHEHDGKVFLEGDFNFFRNEAYHKETMYLLMNASVSFRIIS